MAAPRSVELHKHVLVVVHDQVVERGALQDGHITGSVLSRHLLRLQRGLELAVQEGLSESSDGGGVVRTRERELLDATLVAQVGKHGGRELSSSDAEVVQDLALTGRHVDEQQLALESSSGRSVGGQGRSVVVSVLVSEEQHVLLDGGAEDLLGRLGGEGLHQRHRVGLHELGNVGSGEGRANGVVRAEVVEVFQHDHSVSGHGQLGLDSGGGGDGVGVGLVTVGQGQEVLGVLGLKALEHTKGEHLMGLLELGEVILRVHGHGGRAGLLVGPVDDLVGSAAARVIGRLSTLQVLDGGETLDLEALGKSVVLGGINLGELDGRIRQGLGGLGPLRSQGLAVTAPEEYRKNKKQSGTVRLFVVEGLPRSIELNKELIVGGKGLLEVGLVQHKHVILNGDGGRNDRGNDEEKVDDGSHCYNL